MGAITRRSFALIVALFGALIAGGCLSPTLPLPPPSEPHVTEVDQGRYRLQGAVPLPGQVFAQNLRTDLIFGQNTLGRYDFLVEARPGDSMTLWYVTGTEGSDYVSFEIAGDSELPDAGQFLDGGAEDSGSSDAQPAASADGEAGATR